MTSKVNIKGVIAWMASHPVAANLLMVVFIVGGIAIAMMNTKQEVFPEFELDMVVISVPYPGASPAEVEQGIVLALEESVRGLDGIKKVTATAQEGSGSVVVELMTSVNPNKALQDIKNAVDRITSFPQDAERPVVQLITNRREVISLVIFGDFEEYILRDLANAIREDLLKEDNITNVDLRGVRPLEIAVEVPQRNLRAHDLTLSDISAKVRNGALELPAGGVKTRAGEILVRTAERRDYGQEFADIPVITNPDGTVVRLHEIAEIHDGFRDTDQEAWFNGQPAVQISVFRTGDQKPIEIAETVKAFAKDLEAKLPPGVGVATWNDVSEMYADRINLLVKNAGMGLFLVLLILGAFLEIRLAFWVTMGIPISILGAFLIFPSFDVSINMISLFAFIITLGIIVDDAVVVGENIYEFRERGYSYLEAAIQATRQVAVPVTFSILTNIAAFSPMFFVPGISGKFFRVIPIITISVFVVSLVESLLVLPSHLAHQRKFGEGTGYIAKLRRGQQRFGHWLDKVIHDFYRPVIRIAIAHRYVTVAMGITVLLLTIGMVAGGRIHFTFLPKVDTDVIIAQAKLPFGSPVEQTKLISRQIEEAAEATLAKHGGDTISRGMFTTVGNGFSDRGGLPSGGHLTTVYMYLVPSSERDLSSAQFVSEWREQLGQMAGLESLLFQYSTGPSAGSAIDVELSHNDLGVLEAAASELARKLQDYNGIKDIDDGFSEGKPQYDFTIKPEASTLGLTARELANQLRAAFYGDRAVRQQRGREEVWVMVRLPEEERQSVTDIRDLLIRVPGGGEIPLNEAADLESGRSYTEINRRNGRRVVNVTADVAIGQGNATDITADIRQSILPVLVKDYPGLTYSFEGEQREQAETLSSLAMGFGMAMLVIYAMLAIPFGSYTQPFIVMSAIPFGIVGAILGHFIMGYDLSMISMMGIVALSGVIVNDSLVLIHAANEYRAHHKSAFDAIVAAGMRRFRPILLTSLTTFFGLAPMIMETSVQARFLIPMAISLGFGILFGTVLILILVPSLYLIVEDFHALLGIDSEVDPVGDHDLFTGPHEAEA
ncbi:Efflux RND transporter permease subunit [Sulfidibacter corallicola]|uniref:Efflux RND transporter permease subunit n=1 Tax=Sulfidibacter corallicola TaxID=2818388 RepID=A0A8A4TS34_SULCO|nr:efflux RND transporter permease subunit [Sulfidibacter corallicola]QTD51964.1 efflux RND transporter permease subunit [Sulfidibacter corallicola]